MKKIYFLIICIFIISCSNQQQNLDYDSGTTGIVANFEDKLDHTIYEGQDLSLVVNLQNKGSYDEAYGRVILSGFDRHIMPFRELVAYDNYAVHYLPELESRSPYNIDGGFDTVSFEIPKNSIYLSDFEKYEPNLMLSLCYYYETKATPNVCISLDPFNSKSKICDPFKPIVMQNQGAPVAVTKVEQEVMADFTTFIVTVENVGEGNVITPTQESADACPLNLKHDDLNEFEFEMKLSNTQNPECTPNGRARLVNGKAVIFCKFQLRPEFTKNHNEEIGAEMYTKQLEINIKYFYNTNTYKKLKLAKQPGTYQNTNID